MLVITYGWRGSLIILGGVCIQCLVFAALIRPLYAKKIKNRPTMAAVEEVIPKHNEQQLKPMQDKASKFSSHDGIFRSKHLNIASTSKRVFSSHIHISRHHDTAFKHHKGDLKLNPFNREDVFFSGSTYDIEQLVQKSHKKDGEEDVAGSQITISSIPVNVTGCDKIKANIKKNFNLRIFKSLTFCLVVMAMTLHHMAFFIPYTYIISLTKEKNIDPKKSEYLIICFGESNNSLF